MQIEEYFQSLQATLAHAALIQSMQISYDRRGTYEGYIRGELHMLDGSTLHVREYVDVEIDIDRLSYAYHFTAADGRLHFRYDNTDHHRHLNLSTHPHHKHNGSEENVVASHAPSLADVLSEIETMIIIP